MPYIAVEALYQPVSNDTQSPEFHGETGQILKKIIEDALNQTRGYLSEKNGGSYSVSSEYRSVPPKQSRTIQSHFKYRGRGKPASYPFE